jgi:hypothetical protein
MPMERFLIAPINAGLETDLRPWQIMDDAFFLLKNAYVFRGRVRKRSGTLLMDSNPLLSRLRASLIAGGAGVGITDSGGAAAGNVRTILGDATLPLSVGQLFTVGNAQYTVISSTPGPQAMKATQGSGTFNISNGDFTITGAPVLTTIFFYTGEPVMGITQYESGAINNHPTYAFDQRYAYLYTPNLGWNRSGTAIWHGDNTKYFWEVNWQGVVGNPVLFVTNFNATIPTPAATDDPIWSFNGATWTPASGANAFYFLPAGGAIHTGPFVATARIIVPFHNRLVLLYTIENDGTGGGGVNTAYVNRARFSWYGNPFAVNAWYEPGQSDNVPNHAAGGSFVDATTEEQIVSAEFVKDRLIVYFERSTWELAYTGNETDPFVWQKLNTELGSQSTFSTVPFDKEILTVGQTGLHKCNGSNVIRFDEKIPDEIFEFKNGSTLRTCGIRDYFNELVYWAYVDVNIDPNSTFPNQVLLFNYRNQSWAVYDDCFTTFGYFEQQSDTTWASSAPQTWEQFNGSWVSGILAANQRQILAGTPEGFVLRINDDESRNAPSMQITNMSQTANIVTLTIMSHNLDATPTDEQYDQDFILIENIAGDAATITALNGKIFEVDSVLDPNTITINVGTLVIGTYTGAGTAARVSNIQITTKQFNPYDKQDKNVYIAKVDFLVQKTADFDPLQASPQITVDYSPSSTPISMIGDATATGAIVGNSILETAPYNPVFYPLESFQKRLAHPIYFQSSGTCIQLKLYMTPAQMTVPRISLADFELEGMILYAQPTDNRMQ